MRLEIENIKRDVLGGLSEFEIQFESMEQLVDAVAAINRFNEEKNSFIRDSFLVAKNNAEAFVSQWKITHSKKVQLVLEDKENKRQEQAKRTKEAVNLISTLDKQYKALNETINQMLSLDKYSIKSPYMSVHSFNKKSFEEINKEFKSCIEETISKGGK